jgi:hypothetical protein
MLSFPRGTKMFQFPRLSSLTYVFSQGLHGITRAGFAHSGISGSAPVSGYPKLIATCYALHRLLAPRNPPQALLCLTNKLPQLLQTIFNCQRTIAQGAFSILYMFPAAPHSTREKRVEVNGFEPMTSCVQGRRSPN